MKFILILLLVASCQSRKIKNDISTIAIDADDQNKILIDRNIEYGPTPLESFKVEHEISQETQVFGLNLSPQLYNSYLYIPYIKKLKKKNIEFHVIGGYGFSSVIAALYANSKNFNDFEWKVFKLYKKLEQESAFSGRWQKIIKESLAREFEDKKIYELKRLLLIPFRNGNNIKYYFNKPVKELVMRSLTSRSRDNYFIRPMPLKSEFKEASSCDVCINVAVLPKMLIFKDRAGDKLQIYSKILGNISQNKENYILINDIDSYLDSPSGLEIFYSKYDKSIEKAVEETISRISTK